MRTKPKDPKLLSCIGEFMNNYLPSVKTRDADTIDSYRVSFSMFLLYLKSSLGLTLRTLTADHFSQKNVVRFKAWLQTERGNAATTVNRRLSDLRGLCRFLLKKGIVTEECYEAVREVDDVKDERVQKFEWLSVEDVRSVLEKTSCSRNPVRDRFMLSLMYESGARVAEVLSLKVGDINQAKGGGADVRIFGKGSKPRITPLSEEIWRQYCQYRASYHSDSGPDEPLFYTVRSNMRYRMSSDNVARILSECEMLTRETRPELPHLHCHLFRRTRAMHLLEADVPMPTISDWLGHSHIETTRIYARVTERMKREALSKLSEDGTVFKGDAVFKYADDEEVLRTLCGLK